jgi:hypothetical protein
MDNHNEFYTNLDSKLNDFMYNSQFEFIHLYAYLYKYCTDIQQTKYKDCRDDLIKFYNNVFEHINVILYNYNLDIFETLINSENKLKLYVNKYNTYNDNLKWLNKLTQYINNELKKLDSTYEKLDYTKYGLEVWYKNVTLNISKFINSKLTYYLDYSKYEINEQDNEHIYYLNELIDTVYYVVNKQIIDQKQFDTHIGNIIFNFLDSNIIELSSSLQTSYFDNYLELVDKYYIFYEKRLNAMNLNYLLGKTRNLYKTYILDKFTNSFKETIYTILKALTFENRCHDDKKINILKLAITYNQDKEYLKIIYNKWINDDYYSITDYDRKIEAMYFYTIIYNKLLKLISRDNIIELSIAIDNLYLTELKNEKSCIELFDKYIRTILYKNEKYLYYFTNLLVYYFEKYRSEEIVFEYYKNYLVRRLYKYNFNSALIKIELTILNELFKYLKTINLHKLNIIKNDINDSKEITKEFNEIYNLGDKIYITTTGIWDISPNEHHLVNEIFKHQYTLFTNQFSSYYNCKYDKRTLKWSDTMTNCILDFNINNKIYQIECPIKYADILYYFNETDIIDDSIALENNDTLELLCQYKLIKKRNNIFTINSKFNYKKSHFIIKGSQTKKIKKKQDTNEIFTQKELLELYIVRTLKHNNLEYEILLTKIKDKFEVSSKFISEILNNLVDKGYLSNENNNYLYVI